MHVCILRNVLEASIQTQIAILLQQAIIGISCFGCFFFFFFPYFFYHGVRKAGHNVVHLNLIDLGTGELYSPEGGIWLIYGAGERFAIWELWISGETGL